MQLFRMEAVKSNDFNQEIIKYYDTAIEEASDLIERLSHVDNICEDEICASVDPKHIDSTYLT